MPPRLLHPLKKAEAYSIIAPSQPVLADEVQTFKALITIHKVLQEGHPVAIHEAQASTGWLDSLARGVSGEGMRGAVDPRRSVRSLLTIA